jgi:hypothetical protein
MNLCIPLSKMTGATIAEASVYDMGNMLNPEPVCLRCQHQFDATAIENAGPPRQIKSSNFEFCIKQTHNRTEL